MEGISRSLRVWFLALALAAAIPGTGRAETEIQDSPPADKLQLTDGREVSGKLVRFDGEVFTLETPKETLEVPRQEVAGLVLGKSEAMTPDPPFKPESESSTMVRAATGASLVLNNGAEVALPAKALPQDARITFRKWDMAAVDLGKSFSMYEVTGIDGDLREPAVLTFPFGSTPADYANPDVTVRVLDVKKGWVDLPITVDPAARTVTAKTGHFSNFEVGWGGPYRTSVVPIDTPVDPPLPVPYYGQFESPWCFAASSQMLLKFYGRDVEIWEIARFFRLSTQHGSCYTNLYKGQYRRLFQHYWLGIEDGSTGYWRRVDSLNGYLREQLHKTRPVLVALRYGRHAVVVTGYNRNSVWIHDPQGIAIAWGLDKTVDQIGDRRLAHCELTWEQWARAVQGGDYWGVEWDSPSTWIDPKDPVAYTIVVTTQRTAQGQPDGPPRVAEEPPYTLTLGSPREYKNVIGTVDKSKFDRNQSLLFLRTDPDIGPKWLIFTWDGTQPEGYRFTPTAFGPSETVSNSDALFLLTASLNNGTPPSFASPPAALRVRMSVRIDDRDLSQKDVTLDAQSTSAPVTADAWGPEKVAKPNLAKLRPPFAPGRHVLKLYLSEVLEQEVVRDRIELPFDLAPAQVQGVRAAWTTEGSPRKVKVTWDENIEVLEKVATLEYAVLLNGKEVGSTEKTELTLESPSAGAPPDIRVVARTKDRKFVSFLSAKAIMERSELPAGTPQIGFRRLEKKHWNGIEITSQALTQLDPAKPDIGLKFVLYRSQSPDQPFVPVNQPDPLTAFVFPDAPLLQAGEEKTGRCAEGKFLFADHITTIHDSDRLPHKPFYYQIGQTAVTRQPEMKDIGKEVLSNVLGPGTEAILRVLAPRNADGTWNVRPDADGWCEFGVALSLAGQQFDAWGAHVKASTGTRTGHFYSGRAEGDRTFGNQVSPYNAPAWIRVIVPPEGAAISIIAEGDGLSASTSVSVPANPDRVAQLSREIESNQAAMVREQQEGRRKIEEARREMEGAAWVTQKRPTDTSDAAAVSNWATWMRTYAARRYYLRSIAECEYPRLENLRLRDAARLASDWKSMLPRAQKEIEWDRTLFDIEAERLAHLEAADDMAARVPDSTERSRAELAQSRRDIARARESSQKSLRESLILHHAAVASVAFNAGDADAYRKAQEEWIRLLSRPEDKRDLQSVYALMASDLVILTGNRDEAAVLLLKSHSLALELASPDRREGLRQEWEQKRPAWWPEGGDRETPGRRDLAPPSEAPPRSESAPTPGQATPASEAKPKENSPPQEPAPPPARKESPPPKEPSASAGKPEDAPPPTSPATGTPPAAGANPSKPEEATDAHPSDLPAPSAARETPSSSEWELVPPPATITTDRPAASSVDQAFDELDALRKPPQPPGTSETPKTALACHQRGFSLWKQGKWPESETAFRQAVQLAPMNGAVRANWAAALLRIGRREQALTEARRAVELGVKAPTFWLYRELNLTP